MEFERQQVYYTGHVQGVGFRYTAQRIAANLDVTGFVKNLSDGRVWLVVEGQREEIDSLLTSIRTSMAANIDEVESSLGEYRGEFDSFQVRR